MIIRMHFENLCNNLEKWGDVSEVKVLLVLAEDTGSGPSILTGSHNDP